MKFLFLNTVEMHFFRQELAATLKFFQCFENVKLNYHETDWDVELGLVFADIRLRSFVKLEVTGGASDRLFVLKK